MSITFAEEPKSLEQAMEDATEIDQDLSFHAMDEAQTDLINPIDNKKIPQVNLKDDAQLTALHQALEKVTQCLELLEVQTQQV